MLSRVVFGGAGRPVMGHSGEGRLLSGHAVPNVFGSGGPAVRSKDSRWRRGIRGPGPPLQIWSVAYEMRVELAGDVSLQGAHDLAGGASFGESAGDVFAGAFIAAHAGEHDPPERMVGLTVAAGVEPKALLGLPRRRREWRDATQMRERGFAVSAGGGCRRRRQQGSRRCGCRRRRRRAGSARCVARGCGSARRALGCRPRAPTPVDPTFGSRVSSRASPFPAAGAGRNEAAVRARCSRGTSRSRSRSSSGAVKPRWRI